MSRPRQFTDAELECALLNANGNAAEAARALGVSRWAVCLRKKQLGTVESLNDHPQRIDITMTDGHAYIGSDAHIWPGRLSTAQRALIYFQEWDPAAWVCLNGDVFDGAKISRWPSVGWEKKPTPHQELDACKEVLARINAPRRFWPFGNHDWRLESYIAKNAEQLIGFQGVHLKDHFPEWEHCWRLCVNKGTAAELNIKHRSSGSGLIGRGKTAGTSIMTGHLHSMNVLRFSDYRGDHFSIDGGTLARVPGEIEVPQFTPWTEDNPVDWAAGFFRLTWRAGTLLWPEPIHVINEREGLVSFRGDVIHV